MNDHTDRDQLYSKKSAQAFFIMFPPFNAADSEDFE